VVSGDSPMQSHKRGCGSGRFSTRPRQSTPSHDNQIVGCAKKKPNADDVGRDRPQLGRVITVTMATAQVSVPFH
jgi:hypothetical protein